MYSKTRDFVNISVCSANIVTANDVSIQSMYRRLTGSVRPVWFNRGIISTRCLPTERHVPLNIRAFKSSTARSSFRN